MRRLEFSLCGGQEEEKKEDQEPTNQEATMIQP